ncbi:hypothetical protein Sru01_26070 [Sphaerisporangium rufum]|uniref:Uncharacterized protein n=1 Tax=Sphaerisporangium rufum TaxID=1381558 RepID=A0A919V4U7_9ACTN|nr:hypothetical protein Sru01_26070 [Sphaerisporangium rufum]
MAGRGAVRGAGGWSGPDRSGGERGVPRKAAGQICIGTIGIQGGTCHDLSRSRSPPPWRTMESPPAGPPPLPRRAESKRCAELDQAGLRCVLPVDHPGSHIHPRPGGT